MKVILPRVIAALVLVALGWYSNNFFSPSAGTSAKPQGEPAWRSGAMGRGMGGGRGGYGGGSGTQEVIPVEVSSTLLAVIRERVRSSGILEPEREVTVLSRVEGTVDEVKAVEGARIREGENLCAIDQRELRIAAEVADIELEQANANYDRLEALAKTGNSSGEVLENARFAKKRAQAGQETAMPRWQARASYSRRRA